MTCNWCSGLSGNANPAFSHDGRKSVRPWATAGTRQGAGLRLMLKGCTRYTCKLLYLLALLRRGSLVLALHTLQ